MSLLMQCAHQEFHPLNMPINYDLKKCEEIKEHERVKLITDTKKMVRILKEAQ